jgi:acyl-CoA thioesterase II
VSGHELFQLALSEEGTCVVPQPSESTEGRDVVFSGQLMAQSMVASYLRAGGTKTVRSVHSIFARAGSYQTPLELAVEPMQAGRTWASDTVTATQGGKLLTRSLVLLHAPDPDLFRHASSMPDVRGPDELEDDAAFTFPGVRTRSVPGATMSGGGTAALHTWHRFPGTLGSQAEHQGVLAWGTCGAPIGLAMRDHGDVVSIDQAHRTVSTGVIAHTIHFLDDLDATEWLLIVHDAAHAGSGRVHGTGQVFTGDGQLVATFSQDSMARASAEPLDPSRSM